MTKESTIEARVAANEANTAALAKDVQSVSETVERLRVSVETGMGTLAERLGSVGRTNWGTLAAWASVILAIGALAGGSIMWQGSITASRQEKMAEREIAALAAGHAQAYEQGRRAQQADNADSAIVKLDANLQREVRDLIAPIITRLEQNTDVLRRVEDYQNQMREFRGAVAARLDALEKQP